MTTQVDRGGSSTSGSDIQRAVGLVSSLGVKAPCRVTTSAAITLSGTQTINGVAVVADDSVLVKNQVDTTENGIYLVQSGAWIRRVDCDGINDLMAGTLILVTSGTLAGLYQTNGTYPITVGTSAISFTKTALSATEAAAYVASIQAIGDAADADATAAAASAASAASAATTATNAAILLTQSARTLASSATPSIWASGEATILMSGTSTVTGLTAAPQAGARRTLIATGTFSLTVGANLIMEGWPTGTYKFAVNDRIEIIALTTTQFLLRVIRADGGTLADVGFSENWAANSTPAHVLVEDGSAVSRTTYANLFTKIGTTHGVGDGSTTFNLPNVPANYADVQSTGGNEGTSTVGVVLNHTHPVYANTGATSSASQAAVSVANTGSSSPTGNNTSGGSANLAAGVRFRKCIRF